MNRVYTLFAKADTNQSGTLSFSEIQPLFKKIVPHLQDTQQTYSLEFDKIDANNSGYVDFIEYLA